MVKQMDNRSVALSSGHGDASETAVIEDMLIEIHDPAIDPAAIMAEIRQRISERRAAQGYDSRQFPTFGAAGYQGEPQDLAYDADLHHYLRLVNEMYAVVDTDPVLAPSPATRVPVLGKLWQLVRGFFHQLVLFYVNRAVAQQTSVNSNLVSVLNRMTVVMEEQQRTIERLERQVAELQKDRP